MNKYLGKGAGKTQKRKESIPSSKVADSSIADSNIAKS